MAGMKAGESQPVFGGAHGRTQIHSLDATGAEVVDLILHERDQRSYNHREPRQQECRHLKGDRLTAAGEEEAEVSRPSSTLLYDLPLAGAE